MTTAHLVDEAQGAAVIAGDWLRVAEIQDWLNRLPVEEVIYRVSLPRARSVRPFRGGACSPR